MSIGVTAHIGLGSNLGDPVATLERALRDLDGLPSTRCVGWSAFYRNPPFGPPGQGDYVNAVAVINTRLRPHSLLRWLLRVERRHGRIRGRRWGPRTLDLDLLLYGRRTLRTKELEVPHPRLHQRPFVIYPLASLRSVAVVPGRGALRVLVAGCSPRGLRRVSRHRPRTPV